MFESGFASRVEVKRQLKPEFNVKSKTIYKELLIAKGDFKMGVYCVLLLPLG